MNKTEMLNALFTEWENAIPEYRGRFFKDGIVCEKLFSATQTKVLFIAKEPNNPEQKSGDFREWWQHKLKYAFSLRIAEWSYGIQHNFPPYDDIRNDKDSAHRALQKVAFMNIKKSGGGGKSNSLTMIKHLRQNIGFLHQQIDIITPDLIVTGISDNKLRSTLFPEVKWINSGYDVALGRYKDSRVIDFYHPSSRIAPSASYSLLQNIVRTNAFRQL